MLHYCNWMTASCIQRFAEGFPSIAEQLKRFRFFVDWLITRIKLLLIKTTITVCNTEFTTLFHIIDNHTIY